jgi:hypothetical protein
MLSLIIHREKIKLNLKVEKQYEIYKKKHLYLFLLQLNDKAVYGKCNLFQSRLYKYNLFKISGKSRKK